MLDLVGNTEDRFSRIMAHIRMFLIEAVLMHTHNLCFEAKMRKYFGFVVAGF